MLSVLDAPSCLGQGEGREKCGRSYRGRFACHCWYSFVNFPLKAAPGAGPEPPEIGYTYYSHRIRTRPPVKLGTVRAGSGMTRAGVYQGSLLISTQGRALRPGSQAGLRRLIMLPDRVSADGHAKGRPVQVAFSLAAGDYCPLRVSACAVGRSSVRVVTRTAGVKLSMCGSLAAMFLL